MASSFARALRQVPKSIDPPSVNTHATALRTAARTQGNPSVLGDIFDSATFGVNTRNGGGLTMGSGNIPIEDVARTLRRGELRNFAGMVGGGTVSPNAEAAFRATLRAEPENIIRNLDDSIAVNRVRHPDLDVRVNDNSTGESLRNSMTPEGRVKFENAMNKLRALVGTTGTAFGVFAVIVLSLDFYQSMVDATLNRRGCFYAVRNGNTVTSCRLLARTCWEPNSTAPLCPDSPNLKYNIAIMLNQSLNDNTLRNTLETLIGTAITTNSITDILTTDASVRTLITYYNENSVTITNPCAAAPQLEQSIQLCRACESSANLTSLLHFDDSELPDNATLVCVPTGSVLETLIDVGFGLGVDLVQGVGDKLSNSVSGNLWFIMLFLIILVVIVAVVRLFKSDKPK